MAEVTFADWTDRLKVYNDYIKALAEYKLKTAQAEVEIAKAADLWADVRAKHTVIDQIQRELKAFNQAQASMKREIKQVEDREKAALRLLRGSKLETNAYSNAWANYVWFETSAVIGSGDKLYLVKVKQSARTADNFIVTSPKFPLVAATKDIDNGLKLMDWMNDHRFVADRGSDAQQVVVKLFQEINAVATKTVADINARLAAIRKNTFDAWNFNAILGVSPNPAAKKIESAGAK